MDQNLYNYVLQLGDNSMILGHRLSELCGHGPSLETDIALTNISLDLFGQVRNYFQYAAKLAGGNSSEDEIAHFRTEREFKNVWLVEQPNTDFAYVIARQFLFDSWHLPLLEALQNSADETIAAIAKKSIKEVQYHHRFSTQWIKRLGDGTQESNRRLRIALDDLLPMVYELYRENEVDREMAERGIGADLNKIREQSQQHIKTTLSAATMEFQETPPHMASGKQGIHSEYLGPILAEFQYMQRTYPGLEW